MKVFARFNHLASITATFLFCLTLLSAPVKAQDAYIGGISERVIQSLNLTKTQSEKFSDIVTKMQPKLDAILHDLKTDVDTKEKKLADLQSETRKQFVTLLTPEQRKRFEELEKAAPPPVAANPATNNEQGNNFLSGNGGLGLTVGQNAKLKAYYNSNIHPKLLALEKNTTLTPDQKQQKYDAYNVEYQKYFLSLLTPTQREALEARKRAVAALATHPSVQPLPGGLSSALLKKLNFSPKQTDKLHDLLEKTMPKLTQVLSDKTLDTATKKKQYLDIQADFRQKFRDLLTKEQRAQLDAQEEADRANAPH